MGEELIEYISYTLFIRNEYVMLQKSDIIGSPLLGVKKWAKELPKFLWVR